MNGKSETETIGSSDVKAIDIRSNGDGDGDPHVIIIRLSDDRKIRSPELANRNQAQALRGVIARRLGIPQDVAKPAG